MYRQKLINYLWQIIQFWTYIHSIHLDIELNIRLKQNGKQVNIKR